MKDRKLLALCVLGTALVVGSCSQPTSDAVTTEDIVRAVAGASAKVGSSPATPSSAGRAAPVATSPALTTAVKGDKGGQATFSFAFLGDGSGGMSGTIAYDSFANDCDGIVYTLDGAIALTMANDLSDFTMDPITGALSGSLGSSQTMKGTVAVSKGSARASAAIDLSIVVATDFTKRTTTAIVSGTVNGEVVKDSVAGSY